MAKIDEAFEKMVKLEFNSPSNALHYNKGEKGYTFMGIYEYAHPEWAGWRYIHNIIDNTNSMSEASVKLYYNDGLLAMAKSFYKSAFWDVMRLDEIDNQHTAEEIFVMGVNAGCKTAIRLAQLVVGAYPDGLIGPNTIKALNSYDRDKFDVEYDQAEIEHYEKLVYKNPNFKKFIKGWRNRAVAV